MPRGQTNAGQMLQRAANRGAALAVNHLQGVSVNSTPVGLPMHTTEATQTTTPGTATDVHAFITNLDSTGDPDAVTLPI